MKLISSSHCFCDSHVVKLDSGVKVNVVLYYDQDGDLIDETYTQDDGEEVTDELKNEVFEYIEANQSEEDSE